LYNPGFVFVFGDAWNYGWDPATCSSDLMYFAIVMLIIDTVVMVFALLMTLVIPMCKKDNIGW
jgi:hypothetical protein